MSSNAAEPGCEDLHGQVLRQAFNGFLANPDKIMCFTQDRREIAINRNVFLLLSPLLRGLISSIPSSILPTVFLPEISASSLMKLTDILETGTAQSFLSLTECKTVLEAATMLNIPMQGLCFGGDRPEGSLVKLNIGTNVEDSSLKNMFNIERRKGNKILLVCENGTRVEAAMVAESLTQKISTGVSNINVKIKQEAIAPGEKDTPEQEDKEQENEEVSKDELPLPPVNDSLDQGTEDLKHKCEKCDKGFASITLLRYHYCSHFRGLLKKRFDHMFLDNKCLSCLKTFSNPGRLLLHIGVQHDKINEILKMKGLTVLPPWTTLPLDEETLLPHQTKTEPRDSTSDSVNSSTPTPAGTATPVQTSVLSLTTSSTISTISTISTTSASSAIKAPSIFAPPGPPAAGSLLNLKVSSSVSATYSKSSLPSSTAAGSPNSNITGPTSTSAPKPESTPCNYELECEVCGQKQRSIQLLEQHCCRHFMKELQEQYSNLIDGLKCTICNNVFKQKHSLLLHIGCKHGKVNDILKQKGWAALPCPVNATSNSAMQKQLIQIKKEKMETAEEKPSPSEPTLEESSTTNNFMSSSLDEILRRYKFTTGAGGQLKKI